MEQKNVLQRARSDGQEISSLSKKLQYQKAIETSKPLDSSLSSGQVTTTTSSEQSSSPASSQMTNAESNLQIIGFINPQQKITTPTIERLLPIGTSTRTTSSKNNFCIYVEFQ